MTISQRIRPNLRDQEMRRVIDRTRGRLAGGELVRVTLYLRGREAQQPELGAAKLNELVTRLSGEAVVIRRAPLEVLLSPRPSGHS